ncbi:MAG: apolipoprotein N-acyltransferase [Bacteroides sp.]|nr:apolipoprotein N-acyltransferase [Prevotella sp.]MCM1408195.1 apolipoprotein N-acyltransferase [Treponema brennaborense]MCM1469519.1 apolipoprotein N-acyltransferase [Bacteroides sp.]
MKSFFSAKKYQNLLLLAVSIVLFALMHPGAVFYKGCAFFSYFYVLPVFFLVRNASWKSVSVYGMLYGIGSYCFFAYWLSAFHPMGITVISCLYGVYLAAAFPLMKAAWVFFPKRGWLAQWCVWCGYEFVKTLGFAGFHYGVTAYTHYRVLPLIQCADIAGVWGISALITFPAAWLSVCISELRRKNAAVPARAVFSAHLPSGAIWCIVFFSALVYGLVPHGNAAPADKTVSVALIQQNSDPWRGGKAAYRENLKVLMRLTDAALAENPDTDLIVWPETAFIPRIEHHYQTRKDSELFLLVRTLLEYIDSKQAAFVIGNDHAEFGFAHDGEYRLLDYNAALLFEPRQNTLPPVPEKYFKTHLVPFTEYFPFEKLFPRIYRMLLNGDTHLWEKGQDPRVLSIDGVDFGTPICFEDTFGSIGRRFVKNGARFFVNISNDAWSKSLACQYQHVSMAVFRSIENRIPSVRATASGQTCIISAGGGIEKMAEPFCETYITGEIPVCTAAAETVYTKFGDYAGYFFLIMSCVLLAAGAVRRLYITLPKKQKTR